MDKRLNEKNIFYRKLVTLVFPIAFQNFMMAAVSASDALMLGMINQDYLSSVSLASQVQFMLSLFLAALTIGTTILVAQYWGKNDIITIEKIFSIVIKISFIISLCFFVLATFHTEEIMKFFTTDLLLIEKGSKYLNIVGVSYLFTGISQIYLCIMKNCGDAIKSTFISSVSMILNIILNGIFIFGFGNIPSFEIAGAAIATVISKAIELLWVIMESLRKDKIKLRKDYIISNNKILMEDFLKYTLPVLGNELVWGVGFTMYSVIMGRLGSDAVAANSIANIVKNLIACVCIGIGGASAIIVGNELGRGNLDKAKRYGDSLFKLSIIGGIISGITLICITPLILKCSNLNFTAVGYLNGMLIMCSYYLIGKSINSTIIAGIFCAGGDSKFGFKCDTITMWGITVPLGIIAALYLKIPILGVYFIINLDEIIKLPAVYYNYKKYNWIKDITQKI
ncbi:MATE family efflux transporter [Clostridium sp. D53t1_180928_C8]|uniref:MATE family efflux transporter n=1 Tax=Clostridium sp. D53t1_180928_C8 TaxID=2787101 RepID=UPI0018A939B7|nr:MATE family efflux transporter [Clostridium sp. D53t1_180928_C8]